MKEPKWNIYIYDVNTDSIAIYNIFEHTAFRQDMENAYTDAKGDFAVFKKLVKKYLYKNFYHNNAYDNPKWNIFILPEDYKYGCHVVDVYGQLTLNEDIFMQYLWNTYNDNN